MGKALKYFSSELSLFLNIDIFYLNPEYVENEELCFSVSWNFGGKHADTLKPAISLVSKEPRAFPHTWSEIRQRAGVREFWCV